MAEAEFYTAHQVLLAEYESKLAELTVARAEIDSLMVQRDEAVAQRAVAEQRALDLEAEVARLKAELAEHQGEPATARVMLGVNDRYYDDFVSKAAPMPAKRIYTAQQDVTGSFWLSARATAEAGILPVVTSKRADAAFLSRLRTHLSTFPIRPRVDYFHEPEDNVESGQMTLATYLENSRRFSDELRDVADIGWCMMAYSWRDSNRDPEEFYPGEQYVDFHAADGYQRDGFPTWDEVFSGAADFARTNGKPFAVYEYGTNKNLSGATPERRAAEMRNFRTWATGCDILDMAVYWESAVTKSGQVNDYQFRNDPVVVEAYREMANDPVFQRG